MNENRLLVSRKWSLPCFMPGEHSPNSWFVGREDVLAIIDGSLLPSSTLRKGDGQRTRFFALCGMGGIGKTDVAVQYAFSRRDHFDAVFWIDAGGVSQLLADFGRIAPELGLLSPHEVVDLESSKEIAKAWLNKSRNPHEKNESWLMIFDNADVLDLVSDYIPYSGNGSVLLTSRDPNAKTHFFDDGLGMDLEPLPVVEAASLLRKLVETGHNSDETSASIQVAIKVDGLPLAMTQMAGFIRRKHLSIQEFVSLYSTDSRYAEVHCYKNPAQARRYGATLATFYNFQDFSINARRLLHQLAFLNPDRIREDIFVNPNNQTCSWTSEAYVDARYELLSSSLIRRNIDKKELWIHRVIQAELRTHMKEDDLYENFNQSVLLLAAIWPPGDLCTQASKRWPLCEDLLPHLERFHQLYMEYYAQWHIRKVEPAFPTLLNEAAV